MVALRERYFMKGGLFLRDAARDAYFALQEELKSVSSSQFKSSGCLDEATYELLRSKGSTLRSALVRDVGTRKASEMNELFLNTFSA